MRIMNLSIRTLNLIAIAGLLLAACNVRQTTPTPEGVFEEPINPLPEQEITLPPTPSPSATTQLVLQIATATGTATAGIPTEAPTPTETLGPWEHVVQPGEILSNIIQRPPYNYRENIFGVIDEVVRLNNLRSAEDIRAGATILIPRPTPTPIPQGAELTATVNARLGLGDNSLPINTEFGCHTVRENETIVGIIDQYGGATLEIIAQINPDINFFGCDFDQPSGGPNCVVLLRPNQCVFVPLPTPTPTLSPTPSGRETATPTPTYRPPSLVYPPEGGIAGAGVIELQWVNVGPLLADQYYLVEVTDTVTGQTWRDITKSTSLRLPASLIPTDGQTHTMTWTVRIVVVDPQGVYAPIDAPGRIRTFLWQSR